MIGHLMDLDRGLRIRSYWSVVVCSGFTRNDGLPVSLLHVNVKVQKWINVLL